jgi:hypothetical protein
MKTVPAAMTWEMFARGRWHLLSGMLSSIALPAFVLMAMKHDGALNAADPTTVTLHTVFTLLGIMLCGASLIQSQGKIAQLFTYPLRTTELVAWRMLPAMVIISIQIAFVTAVLNAMFDLRWPIWGPALFAAAALASITATLWLVENSPVWFAIAIGLVGGFLGLWFQTRYGRLFARPDHYWLVVTPRHIITLTAISVAAYCAGVLGVARRRCGKPPFSLGIVDRITQYLESFTTFNTVARAAFDSQCRYEWRRKGWLMPAAVLISVLGGTIGWFFTSRDPEVVVLMFMGMGASLSLFGVIAGMALGNTGSNDANYGMASFLATRPISDADLARAILKTVASSVLLSWVIWATAFATVCLGLCAVGESKTVSQLIDVNWLVHVATLLGPWAVAGILASICFFGRLGALITALAGISGGIVAIALVNTFISPELQSLLRQVLLIGGSLLVLMGASWLFNAARRKKHIDTPIVSASAAFWSIGVAAVLIFWPTALPFTFSAILLSLAAMALVVIPLAAAPLALSANRHR